MQTTSIGARGEALAAQALLRSGYRIIARNWKTRHCEIDIVAIKDGVVYFVEVKLRSNLRQGDGFDYITSSKQRRMYRAAESWVLRYGWNGEYTLVAAAVNGNTGVVDLREL